MAKLRFSFDGKNGDLGKQFKRGTKRWAVAQVAAIKETAERASDQIVFLGRQNMSDAGNFKSERWQQGLQAPIDQQGDYNITIRVTHSVPYWRVFEYAPTVINGKPLLWIPLSFAGIEPGVSAKDFPEPLFRVDRAGKAPLLMSKSGPKYFGKESVTITTKWDLRGVTRKVVAQLPDIYADALRRAKANG